MFNSAASLSLSLSLSSRKLSSQQQSWSKENRLNETDQSMGNSYEPLHIPQTELPPSPSPHTNGVIAHFHMDIDPKWEVRCRAETRCSGAESEV